MMWIFWYLFYGFILASLFSYFVANKNMESGLFVTIMILYPLILVIVVPYILIELWIAFLKSL